MAGGGGGTARATALSAAAVPLPLSFVPRSRHHQNKYASRTRERHSAAVKVAVPPVLSDVESLTGTARLLQTEASQAVWPHTLLKNSLQGRAQLFEVGSGGTRRECGTSLWSRSQPSARRAGLRHHWQLANLHRQRSAAGPGRARAHLAFMGLPDASVGEMSFRSSLAGKVGPAPGRAEKRGGGLGERGD